MFYIWSLSSYSGPAKKCLLIRVLSHFIFFGRDHCFCCNTYWKWQQYFKKLNRTGTIMWSDQSRSMGSVIWGSTVIGVALLRREKEVFLKIKQNKWQWVGGHYAISGEWSSLSWYPLMFVTRVFGSIKPGTLTKE